MSEPGVDHAPTLTSTVGPLPRYAGDITGAIDDVTKMFAMEHPGRPFRVLVDRAMKNGSFYLIITARAVN